MYALNVRLYSVTGLWQSNRDETNRTGDLVERATYTAYGQRTLYRRRENNNGPVNGEALHTAAPAPQLTNGLPLNPFGFQGKLHTLNGNTHHNARDFHPQLQRWTARDPLDYPDGMNTYVAYHVMGWAVDPQGLSSRCVEICTDAYGNVDSTCYDNCKGNYHDSETNTIGERKQIIRYLECGRLAISYQIDADRYDNIPGNSGEEEYGHFAGPEVFMNFILDAKSLNCCCDQFNWIQHTKDDGKGTWQLDGKDAGNLPYYNPDGLESRALYDYPGHYYNYHEVFRSKLVCVDGGPNDGKVYAIITTPVTIY